MSNNEVANTNNNEVEKQPLQDIDISHIIFIKNPNNELAIGYCAEEKLQTDTYNSNASIKQITHHHYGTIANPYPNNGHAINRIFLTFTRQDYSELKIHSLLLKYMVLVLSILLIILDKKNIKQRINQQEEIIAELRTIHIQMDDLQLYQIFWSFLIVYIGALICYCVCTMVIIVYDSHHSIKYMFRLLMFTLLYQLIETILRRYDFLLMFMRIILILLCKIWISINMNLSYVLIFHPEYASASFNAPRNLE